LGVAALNGVKFVVLFDVPDALTAMLETRCCYIIPVWIVEQCLTVTNPTLASHKQ